MYRALAEIADQRLELLRHWRVGKGVWHALVDVMWDDDNVGRSLSCYSEMCTGKQAAIIAARRLLAEHASEFGDGIAVETEVLTDLEWQARQRDVDA